MTFCDLHIHSYYSDGSDSPRAIVEKAAAIGLRAVALTDHNTAAGLGEFADEAARLGINAVAGVELSTLYREKELHLLGLFIPQEHYKSIEAFTDEYKNLKTQSNIDLISKLCAAGYLLDYAQIEKTAKGNINRAHIAAELVRLGYIGSINEAFDKILAQRHGFYSPPPRPDLFETIAMLRSLSILPVLAHPLQELSADELRELLPMAIKAGLVGIEILHSSYSEEQKRIADEIAKEFNILASGGSDYHGNNKPDISLGTGKGDLQIPAELYDKLCERSRTL